MITLTYNGISIQADSIAAWHTVPVMNGPDRLYLQHDIYIVGVFNPARNAFLSTPELTIPPSSINTRITAPNTHKNIRDYLLMPQKPLTITMDSGIGGPATTTILSTLPYNTNPAIAGNFNQLDSLGNPLTLDAANGPTPLGVNVTEIVGTKTFFVEFGIRVSLNEVRQTLNGAKPKPAILSNRWEQRISYSPSFWATVITTGKVVFDTSRLAFLNLQADNYRQWFSVPILTGFKRDSLEVSVSSDGTTAHYRIIDIETPFPVVANNIADIDYSVSWNEIRPGGLGILAQVLGQTANTAAATQLSSREGSRVGKALTAVASAVAAASAIQGSIARSVYAASMTVYGKPTASTQDLFLPVAQALLRARADTGAVTAIAGRGRKNYTDSCQVTFNAPQRVVQFAYSAECPAFGPDYSTLVDTSNTGLLWGNGNDFPVTQKVFNPGSKATSPGRSNDMRTSSLIGNLVVQNLQSPGLTAGSILVTNAFVDSPSPT